MHDSNDYFTKLGFCSSPALSNLEVIRRFNSIYYIYIVHQYCERSIIKLDYRHSDVWYIYTQGVSQIAQWGAMNIHPVAFVTLRDFLDTLYIIHHNIERPFKSDTNC